MSGVDIAYVISHGFAMRMLIQTDLLGRLQARGLSVAVIAPDPEDATLNHYCRPRDIAIHGIQSRSGFLAENHQFKRKYFLEDIEANPALYEKHVHAVRYNKSSHPLRRLRPYYYWLVYRLVKKYPALRERFRRREARYLHSEEARILVETLKPRRVVSTYPIAINEARLLHYGNRADGVETWIHLLSWDNITAKGHFPETASRYIAWGSVMRDELQAHYGVPATAIHMCGVPHFDVHVSKQARCRVPEMLGALGLDPARPYVLVAMSAPRFAPREIDIVEWLGEQVERGAFGGMQLIVRPHPQNVQGDMADRRWLPRLERLHQRQGVAVAFPQIAESRMLWSMLESDMLDLATQLAGATVVLNSGSTVSIDALMHDTPVIITSFDGAAKLDYWQSARRLVDYAHLAKLVALGGVSVVHGYAALESEIRRYIDHPAHRAAGRARTIEAQCLARDGGATERVVEVLANGIAA